MTQRHHASQSETASDVAFTFKYARVASAAGAFPAVSESVNQYLVTAGRGEEFYREVLAMFLAIEKASKCNTVDRNSPWQKSRKQRQISNIK